MGDHPDIDCEKYKNVAEILLWVYLVMCLFNTVINSLLIHGCRQKRPGLLMPWLVVACLSLLVSMIAAVGQAVQFGFSWNWVGLVIGWAISIYFIIVVKSTRTFLRRSDYF